MAWIDFKSGFALMGSLVVLAGSLDSRMRERKEKPPEPGGADGGPVVPQEPVRPEKMNPDEFRSGVKRAFKALRAFRFKKRTPPTTSA
ncbi:hypothetical protein [Tunturibacter empetritectus]|uniref:Uncharacterized protein n=1 Tax=Tunturiibacter empetritectus TaxID=3069691 RepID=A0A7W8IKM2_9BACT|nr:hypothetical protein [Edaphobacter lichenicola]MBB5318141.1 hypothetical protein [Edaphobacter lichenicola]